VGIYELFAGTGVYGKVEQSWCPRHLDECGGLVVEAGLVQAMAPMQFSV
jgi:hypothetical protein